MGNSEQSLLILKQASEPRVCSPPQCWNRGAKVSFRPRNNLRVEPQKLEWMTPRSNSRTAGELTWRTQAAPKLLAARASPGPHCGSLQHSPRSPSWWGGGWFCSDATVLKQIDIRKNSAATVNAVVSNTERMWLLKTSSAMTCLDWQKFTNKYQLLHSFEAVPLKCSSHSINHCENTSFISRIWCSCCLRVK